MGGWILGEGCLWRLRPSHIAGWEGGGVAHFEVCEREGERGEWGGGVKEGWVEMASRSISIQ